MMVQIATSPEDLPVGANYAYHCGAGYDIPNILDEGIDPSKHISDRGETNQFAVWVAEQEGYTNQPESRSNCCFAYTEGGPQRPALELLPEALVLLIAEQGGNYPFRGGLAYL